MSDDYDDYDDDAADADEGLRTAMEIIEEGPKQRQADTAALKAEVANLTHERDKARKQVATNMAATFCAFCGLRIERDDACAAAITAHVRECVEHPMRIVEAGFTVMKARAEDAEASRDSALAHVGALRVALEKAESALAALKAEVARLRAERRESEMSESYRPEGIVGCGDNSCIFGPPGGMATNGGCRCIEKTYSPDHQRLRRDILVLRRDQMHARADLAALKAEVARLTEEQSRLVGVVCRVSAERDGARAEAAARLAERDMACACIAAAEAERDALRTRIEGGTVMWIVHGDIYGSLDAIDIRLRDDAERFRVLAEPDLEVTP